MLADMMWFLAGASLLSLAVTLIFQGMAWRVVRRPRPPHDFTPPITVLKPLTGVDEGLLDNLRSVAQQNYPVFEIIFGMENPNDPARDVVRQLQREFPNVPMHVVVASPQIGRNPKVNNLAGMSKRARYDYLLISDANVRVAPTYLRDVVGECADKRVGLVANLIAGSHAQTVGSMFEDLHLTAYIGAAVCGAKEIGDHPCVVGKSMLMRKSDLEALGGWKIAANVLAEDYVLGQAFYNAGWRVALSPHVVQAVHVRRSISDFMARHIRWAQMRRRVSIWSYLGELLLNPIPACFALWFVAVETLNRPAIALALGIMLIKCLADAALYTRFSGKRLAMWQVMTIPFKDCLMALIWTVGSYRRSVHWRGHEMRIAAGTRLLTVDEDESGLLLGEV